MSRHYKLLDAGDFYKLEDLCGHLILRPSPAAVWPKNDSLQEYLEVSARYDRYQNGKGEWKKLNKNFPQSFNLELLGLNLELKPTGFGHLGVFFEQIDNWTRLSEWVKPEDNVLNLFAYTGVASLVCAKNKANVVHVDASKTSVTWARKNQELSELDNETIRWIVEDVAKFIQKEVRRGKTYEWIILDPPSFGRGTKNESWIIEEDLLPLMKDLSKLKSEFFKGILLSSHSPGYSSLSLDHILTSTGFNEPYKICEEMVVYHPTKPLPSGNCAWRLNFKV